jgi:hypothetical protein
VGSVRYSCSSSPGTEADQSRSVYTRKGCELNGTLISVADGLYAYTKLLAQWRGVLVEKLISFSCSSNSLHFTEPEVSLACSQEPDDVPYPELVSPHSHFLFLEIHFILSSHLRFLLLNFQISCVVDLFLRLLERGYPKRMNGRSLQLQFGSHSVKPEYFVGIELGNVIAGALRQ